MMSPHQNEQTGVHRELQMVMGLGKEVNRVP